MRDRDFIERLIDRAKAASCSALVLTLDLQILGQRHKDLKNGLSAPPKPTLANLAQPGDQAALVPGHAGHAAAPVRQHRRPRQGRRATWARCRAWTAEQFDPTLNWDDVEWIKKRWGGKLILKGIMDVEDARLAVDSGADALIVTNHGGRQLDGAPSSHRGAAGHRRGGGQATSRCWMDGGIRSARTCSRPARWARRAR